MENEEEEKKSVKAGVVRVGVLEKVCFELGPGGCIT